MLLKINAINTLNNGTGIVLSLGVPSIYGKQIDAIVGDFKPNKELELKWFKEKRSLNANNFLWVLADAIAQKVHTTKESVYRKAVGEVGVFEELEFSSPEAMERFKKHWHGNGTGWLTKTLDEKRLLAYYGSSRYNKQEMARLIDWLMEEAQELDIPTITDEEVQKMIGRWGD